MGSFRKVGLITCTALALANMIGTGVFTSLGFQVAAIPSPISDPASLGAWRCRGPLWGSQLRGTGGSAAPLGRRIQFSFADLSSGHRLYGRLRFRRRRFLRSDCSFGHGPWANIWLRPCPASPPRPVSVAAVLLLAAVHSLTVRASGNFQVLITALKVGLIVPFIVIGISAGRSMDIFAASGRFGLDL